MSGRRFCAVVSVMATILARFGRCLDLPATGLPSLADGAEEAAGLRVDQVLVAGLVVEAQPFAAHHEGGRGQYLVVGELRVGIGHEVRIGPSCVELLESGKVLDAGERGELEQVASV